MVKLCETLIVKLMTTHLDGRVSARHRPGVEATTGEGATHLAQEMGRAALPPVRTQPINRTGSISES